MISDTIIYKLEEEAVRNWNQPSNVPLLKKDQNGFYAGAGKIRLQF